MERRARIADPPALDSSAAEAPVSLGITLVEPLLPFSTVYYPNLYGTFIAFSGEGGEPHLCRCAEPAVRNYLALRSPRMANNSDPLRMAPLDNYFFPDVLARASMDHVHNPLAAVKYLDAACHRCCVITPSARWCDEMYGGVFKQRHGWYIRQASLRLGVSDADPIVWIEQDCPMELQELARRTSDARTALQRETNRLMAMVHGPLRTDITPTEVTYSKNVKLDEAQDFIRLRKAASAARRAYENFIENTVRAEFGFSAVGDGWVSESLLWQIVVRCFPGHTVLRHYRPDWLCGLELDIFIPALNLGVEYQGQQHYHPVAAWGGQDAFDAQVQRDRRKASLCKARSVRLIDFAYTEPLTESHVRQRLADAGIDQSLW